MKKIIIITLSILVTFFVFATVKNIIDNSSKNYLKQNIVNKEDIDFSSFENSSSSDYYHYIKKYDMKYPANEEILIEGKNFTDATSDIEILSKFEGENDVILTSDEGDIIWSFNVEKDGYYNIGINYYPYEGNGSNIERTLLINDEIPFNGAENLVLHRLWGSETEIKQDLYGNDIRPSQVEKPNWIKSYFKDSVGYVNGKYAFYFKQGENTITLRSLSQPMVIKNLIIESIEELKTYEDLKKSYEEKKYELINENVKLFEAENLKNTTSPTLYPLNDTGASTSPTDPKYIKLNIIGGDNWRISGDRITWNLSVEKSGLYNVSLRVRQNLATGMVVTRNIYINNEIPFKELENYTFKFNSSWRIQTLGTDKEAFKFYFEAGKEYEFSMETSLGSYGPKIAQIENVISNLSKIYREILVFTGPEPDPNRDYQLTTRVPNLISRLNAELEELHKIRDKIIEISGSKSEKTGILDTIILQIEDFLKKPSQIHKKLTTFNNNVSSLGTLIILLSDQPLELDYIAVHGSDGKLPKNSVNIFKQMFFSIRAFFASFTTDYSSVGKTTKDANETINVWLTVGKDQANILRKLIDEKFTPMHDIQVDLKLVSSASLLPATSSGKGPDVAMGVGTNVPVNYALRNASYDLTKFSDFKDIIKRFNRSAYESFEFGDGTYALPEQEIFMMMFYRTDIFDELGLNVPNTWQDVIKMIPDLQKYNLEFFLPVPRTQGAVVNLPPNPIFSTMFYQNGGSFYINNNTESGFNEGLGPEVFETWTQFYTDYSFPVEANFANRFRSGQMPLGITYYNTYNTLSVFAPEIRGKWGFLPVPGTEYIDENGEKQIRRDTVSTNTGAMILNNSSKKDASWEFLKWWTSTDTQVRFGREMEGILGAAARYPTANVEAFESLPWKRNELEVLKEQWSWVRGIPEVPGSYMTGRHLDNAFRMVINETANPREVIYDYVQIINEEINKKRKEFNLN